MDRTQKQRMLAGEIYDPDDPELHADSHACIGATSAAATPSAR